MNRTPLVWLLLCGLAAPLWAAPPPQQTLVARPFAASQPVLDLALSGDGELVVGACGDRLVLWDAASGRRLDAFPTGDVHTVVSAGSFVVTGETDPVRLRTWDLTRRQVLAEAVIDPGYRPLGELDAGSPPQPEVVLAASPDGALVAAAWKDEVRVLRTADLSLVRLLRAPPAPSGDGALEPAWLWLHVLEWSADGRCLRAWGAQHVIGWRWDLQAQPQPQRVPPGSPDERPGGAGAFASSSLSDGGAVELWIGGREAPSRWRLVRSDAQGDVRWERPLSFRDVAARGTVLALEAQGRVLVSGSGPALSFSLADGQPCSPPGLDGLRGLFAGPGQRLVLWDAADRLWSWDAAQGGDPQPLPSPLGQVAGERGRAVLLDVDPGQGFAAAELQDGRVLLWELEGGTLLASWRDGDAPNLTGLAVRVVGGEPRCFYNACQGEGRVRSEGGRTLIDYTRGVRLLARDRQGRSQLQRDPDGGSRFVVSPDGQHLLADDAHTLLTLPAGPQLTIPHDRRYVGAAAIAPGAARVAVAGLTGPTQLLTVYGTAPTVSELARAELDGVVQDLVFSPDAQRVAAVDRRGALVLDARSGATTRLDLPAAAAAAFLPDGRLAVGSRDGSVTVWSLGD